MWIITIIFENVMILKSHIFVWIIIIRKCFMILKSHIFVWIIIIVFENVMILKSHIFPHPLAETFFFEGNSGSSHRIFYDKNLNRKWQDRRLSAIKKKTGAENERSVAENILRRGDGGW